MTTADLGGIVTSEGTAPVTERGVCWSQSPLATTNDFKQICGAGPGSFQTTIQNLNASTHYYTRAYALNSYGVSYGSEKEFTTESSLPPPSDGILPLAVGNYWNYLPDITTQTLNISITGTITVQGELCYKWYAQGESYEWYYKNKSDGCWAYGYSGTSQYPPDLLYKYPAAAGDNWVTNWIAVPFPTTMTCEATNISFASYSGCYKYHFFLPLGKTSFLVTPYEKYFADKIIDSKGMIGYDIYQYFIPGIGMVGWETWLQGSKLYNVVMTDYHLNP